MKPVTHILAIIAGIAGPVAIEGWTTSDYGPRSKAHYASVVNASQAPRDKAIAFGLVAFEQGDPAKAVTEYFAADAVDNATGTTGAAAIAAAAADTPWLNGGAARRQLQVAGDRDLAFVRYAATETQPETVEIYRIAEGKIAEHWSVVSNVAPEDAQQEEAHVSRDKM